ALHVGEVPRQGARRAVRHRVFGDGVPAAPAGELDGELRAARDGIATRRWVRVGGIIGVVDAYPARALLVATDDTRRVADGHGVRAGGCGRPGSSREGRG